ncbi:hypothetical protein CPB84DRAFT_1785548 [Gymnopilus junonius]|uniref:Fungal-type protein kinase domain-containing protein n=1 Tax=Gymnopilus junonius TaxID=109634 RepID=A0A9P5TL17_GYMJU|nr:hypothetical protein CPB84DRAFT_1785548 [Gymnopilus junonius]
MTAVLQPREDQVFGDHDLQASSEGIEDETTALRAELSNYIYLYEEYHRKAFVGRVPGDDAIRLFLQDHPDLYDSSMRRWTNIPESPELNRDLYIPFCQIIQAIIHDFNYSGTRSLFQGRWQEEENQWKTLPHIMIQGSGKNYCSKSYQISRLLDNSGDHLQCASPLEIRARCKLFVYDWVQLAMYARQCFLQQHNRKAVYSLFLTESDVTLYMFDRSGVQISIPVNIHQDPVTFIRFILGIASPDDEVIGFNTNIYWEGETRYLKVVDSNEGEITYELSDPCPIFSRYFIRSRGTTCWKAIDPKTGDAVLIKEAWRTTMRMSETEFLEEIKNLALPGVVQMLAFQADENDTTAKMRGVDPDSLTHSRVFRSRSFTRIVFVDGGRPIVEFDSKGEVLYALRDAIAGHRNLWQAGILHKDVSRNNILIGCPDRPVGFRGVLIDLDFAMWTTRKDKSWGSDFRTGTQVFQSVNVLKSSRKNKKSKSAPHSYLDDLESFYYVLCWICFGYSAPGERLDPFPEVLRDWAGKDPFTCAAIKGLMFLGPNEPDFEELVTDYFGLIFRNLCDRFRAFLVPHVRRIKAGPPSGGWPTIEQLKRDAVGHYQALLNIFDEAIVRYEQDEAIEDMASNFQKSIINVRSSINSPQSVSGPVSRVSDASVLSSLALDNPGEPVVYKRACGSSEDVENENREPKKLRTF